MTGALLHRSRAFVRLAGVPVDILTFDARPDYPSVIGRLVAGGELIDGMRVLNLWDWLRDNEQPLGKVDLEAHPFRPLKKDAAFPSTLRGDAELSRSRPAADGSTLQVDYYRLDGSLLASDLRDVTQPGVAGGRSVVLCDAAGQPVRSFGSIWGLYRAWLDLLVDGDASFMIVDSKTIANAMMSYRRKRAVTMHLVHSSHLAGTERPIAPLKASRRQVFENLDKFDSVVLLTDRQRQDVVALLGKVPNLAVVPNGRELDGALAPLERDAGRGVVLAALTDRKRVAHALRGFAGARFPAPGSLVLDVFGDGEQRAQLEALAEELGIAEVVRFHGHRADARRELGTASFLLLTSTTEGFPLVLIEAMAAGCIPIAYDVPYGPADIIKHGRNGFLVPAGDEGALAEAIAKLQSMSPRQVTKLRRNARAAASAFSDLAVTKQWAEAMRSAQARKNAEWARSHRAG